MRPCHIHSQKVPDSSQFEIVLGQRGMGTRYEYTQTVFEENEEKRSEHASRWCGGFDFQRFLEELRLRKSHVLGRQERFHRGKFDR